MTEQVTDEFDPLREKPLSEKRKEIFDIMINKCPTIAGRIYRIIRQQDAEAVEKLKEGIEEAQEDCANLDWISKDQAISIINKKRGEFKNGNN